MYADYEDNWKCTECGAHLHHYYSDDSYTIVKSEGDDEDCDDDEHLPISAWKPKRSTTSNAKKISTQSRSNAVSKRGRVFCKVMLFINAIVLACVLLVIILTNEISLIPTLSFFGVLTIMFYVISKTPKKAKHLFGRTTGVRKWSFILICLVALYALPRLAESMLDIASHIPIQRGLSAMGSIVTTHDSVATPEYVYDVVLTGDAVITDYCGSDDSIFIPSELGGHSVIRIADYAFKDCINLKSVSMWADITEIGDYAFVGCSELSKISIPNSTKKIGSHAFEGCESLCDVTLWNAGSIGEYAFAGCVSLSDIRIPTDTSVIGAHAFEKCTGLVSLSIWDAKKIEEYAFAGCTGLTEISVPSETEIIGAHAFDGCINLEKVSLRNRSMQVDSTAFSNCPKLERKPN